MKILSSYTHPQVIPNLQDFFLLLLNTKEDILKNVGNQTVAGNYWLNTVEQKFEQDFTTNGRCSVKVNFIFGLFFTFVYIYIRRLRT